MSSVREIVVFRSQRRDQRGPASDNGVNANAGVDLDVNPDMDTRAGNSTIIEGKALHDGPQLASWLDDLTQWHLVGQGGFAAVYAARQERLGRQVAVKVLNDKPSPSVVRAFLRECEIMGALSPHPNIVTVYDSGTATDGRPYLVMEYMPGGSLAHRIQDGAALPWCEVAEIGVKLVDALDAAHAHGVLHLDVKPANITLSAYGETKLGDFGIARLDAGGATASGTLAYTPFFVAPEILKGGPLSKATDVYGLGATLAALLRGRPLHWRADDNAPASVIARTLTHSRPDLRDVEAPTAVRNLLQQMVDPNPARRPTLDNVRRVLSEVNSEDRSPVHRPTTTKRPGRIVLTTVAAALLTASSATAVHKRPQTMASATLAPTLPSPMPSTTATTTMATTAVATTAVATTTITTTATTPSDAEAPTEETADQVVASDPLNQPPPPSLRPKPAVATTTPAPAASEPAATTPPAPTAATAATNPPPQASAATHSPGWGHFAKYENVYPEQTPCSYHQPLPEVTAKYTDKTITVKYFYSDGCGSFARVDNAPHDCAAFIDRSIDGGHTWDNFAEPVEKGLDYAYTKVANNLHGRVSRAALVCNNTVLARTPWY
jgi:serine/threonine protein kinase